MNIISTPKFIYSELLQNNNIRFSYKRRLARNVIKIFIYPFIIGIIGLIIKWDNTYGIYFIILSLVSFIIIIFSLYSTKNINDKFEKETSISLIKKYIYNKSGIKILRYDYLHSEENNTDFREIKLMLSDNTTLKYEIKEEVFDANTSFYEILIRDVL